MNTTTDAPTPLPCSGADPDIFHNEARTARARKLCAACPLTNPCREQARIDREWGTWGGETSSERAAAGYPPAGWRGRGHKVRLKPCGTLAAYRRHLRAKQKPCPPCTAAEYRRRAERDSRPRRHRTTATTRTRSAA
ncbi:WhiB family transcriptional regulator [Streptomyces marianii]|uniref:WhiB family transcriptional regulator n=1 Tax=Streptomyces marianii TaxID=1817406 RepID=A0A5R9DRZ6_9ACTN|nr:WhiB family transcriptional regulator [Streptomyces marianii]TLQ39387.1 WhiB family transcriptional regulator [Streptomyces marianii]